MFFHSIKLTGLKIVAHSALLALVVGFTSCTDGGGDNRQAMNDTATGEMVEGPAFQQSCLTLKILAFEKAKFPATNANKVVLKHSSLGRSGILTLAWWREGSGRKFAPPVYLDTVGNSRYNLCSGTFAFGDLTLSTQNVNAIKASIDNDSIKYVVFVPVVAIANFGGASYNVLSYKVYARVSLKDLSGFIPEDTDDGFLFEANPSPPATAF